MTAPRYIDDGNFSIARQHGAMELRFPFSSKGDNFSFEALITYRQDQASYRPLPRMFPMRIRNNTCYLVDESSVRYVGNGLMEFVRTFATIPVTRTEYGSIVYPNQYLSTTVAEDQSVALSTGEITYTRDCKILYEYARSADALPTIIAPKIEVLFGKFQFTFGNWGNISPNQPILAQDTNTAIYKGGIYVRVGFYINFIPGLKS